MDEMLKNLSGLNKKKSIKLIYETMKNFILNCNPLSNNNLYKNNKEHILLKIKEKYFTYFNKYDLQINDTRGVFNNYKIINKYDFYMFLIYCIFFYLDNINNINNINNDLVIGIDFEFDSLNNNTSLIQICFFQNTNENMVFVLNPNELYFIENKEIFIKTIFLSSIQLILHGGESMDIPYIYNKLLNNNQEHFDIFLRKMIDTRFLCEYYKSITNELDYKCSLYTALLYFETITFIDYEMLEKNNKKMGKIYKVNWDLKKISNEEFIYVVSDVIYLKFLVLDIFKKSKLLDEKLYINLNLIIEFTRFVYLVKYNLIQLPKVDFNNFIKKNNEILKLNEIISKNNKYIEDELLYFKKIYNINYFKKTYITLTDFIIICFISKNYEIYTDKKNFFYKNYYNISLIEKYLNDYSLHILKEIMDKAFTILIKIGL